MSAQGFKACIIDTIISHRQKLDGRYEFLVKWKKAAPTWQPLQNLTSILDLVERYLDQKEIMDEDNWKKNTLKKDLSKISPKKPEKMEMQIDDQDTRTSRSQETSSLITCQINKEQQFILNYDEFFPSPQNLVQDRYKRQMKKVNQSDRKPKSLGKIEWKNIKKALDIKYDDNSEKWMVELQFYGDESKTLWVQREILRLVNPFLLMDLYGRIQRKQIQAQININQNRTQLENTSMNLERSVIQID